MVDEEVFDVGVDDLDAGESAFLYFDAGEVGFFPERACEVAGGEVGVAKLGEWEVGVGEFDAGAVCLVEDDVFGVLFGEVAVDEGLLVVVCLVGESVDGVGGALGGDVWWLGGLVGGLFSGHGGFAFCCVGGGWGSVRDVWRVVEVEWCVFWCVEVMVCWRLFCWG